MNRPHKFYARQLWKSATRGIRMMKLRRDPLCEVIGCTRPAEVVDHRIAFQQGKTEAEQWFLFIGGIDLANLRSCCSEHHDAKPLAFEKPGAPEFNPLSATGAAGRQILASTIDGAELDRALPQSKAELDSLLSGIPE